MIFDMSVTDTPNLGQSHEAALVLLIGKKEILKLSLKEEHLYLCMYSEDYH